MANRSRKRQPTALAGERAALGEAFWAALLADWQLGGAEAITQMRADKPADYVKLVAALAPKEVRSEPLDELTDAEIAERIAELTVRVCGDGRESRAAASPRGAAAAGGDDAG